MCGEIHPLKIHSLPYRNVLNPELGEREKIQVVVIFCEESKAARRQYTKRLLPDWLIPYSPIRMDLLLLAEQSRREQHTNLEECCEIIGCQEPRTVAKHLTRLRSGALNAALKVAREIARVPHLSPLPYVTPAVSPISRLTIYHQSLCRVWRAAGHPHGTPSLQKLIQTEFWKLLGKISISCTVPIGQPP